MRQPAAALHAYEGALLVARHDLPFLQSIGITRWMRLEDGLSDVAEEVV